MTAVDVSRDLIAALSNPETYGDGVDAVRVVETHISWVFLTGKIAYKVKKPVRLPFLDFSTLAARLQYCEEELRLNRRLAPEIYLDIVPIGGTADRPVIGATPAIEYAVKMVEFPADVRLDRVLARRNLSRAEIAAFAERLAAFHRDLAPAPKGPDYGSSATVRRVAAENLEQSLAAGAVDEAAADALRGWFSQQDSHVDSLLDARVQADAIRECHGDLHLENLIEWRDEIVAFDALEFDAALRFIDPIDEVAFLTMDLLAHGRADVGFRFLNRYLEVTGDYAGIALLRYYMVHRALVRAKVRALSAGAAVARAYADLASQLCQPIQPTLFVTHGFSGSGKTTWTSELLAALPAIRVRSDIVRKQQAGLGELDASGSPVGGGLYDERGNEHTYGVLADYAYAILRARYDVIVDATFLRRGDRERFAALAADTGARLRILDFAADPEALRARIAARAERRDDPSEGTHDVLDWQLAHADALETDELAVTVRIDTETQTPSSLDEAVLARVRGEPQS
jgi:aminoglycoside phosphotransferase family enzyme/predicted kinase